MKRRKFMQKIGVTTLGPAFPVPYTMQRVHEPGTIDSRPGWLRISDYCNAMLTRPFREKWLDKHVIDWMNEYQNINLR
jgi:hypothetical protein